MCKYIFIVIFNNHNKHLNVQYMTFIMSILYYTSLLNNINTMLYRTVFSIICKQNYIRHTRFYMFSPFSFVNLFLYKLFNSITFISFFYNIILPFTLTFKKWYRNHLFSISFVTIVQWETITELSCTSYWLFRRSIIRNYSAVSVKPGIQARNGRGVPNGGQ